MMNSDRQVSQVLMSNLVENILRYSDNPGECAKYITSQIRELVGVRIVAVVADDADVKNRPISVCPDRKRQFLELPEVNRFIDIASVCTTPQIIEATSDAGMLLVPHDITTSFVIPLMAGTERVGMILLLDMLDLKGAATILDTLRNISSVFALILRNSFLYKRLEKMVELRTEQLAKSERLFRALFEQAQDGIIFLDAQGAIIAVNESFARSHGYTAEEIRKMGITGLDPEGNMPVAERIQRLFAGEAMCFEVEHRHKDGHLFPLEVTANIVSLDNDRLILVIHRDISARKRAEEEHARYEKQLLVNSKLESLGVLAGGIAHDFNNLMGGIFGYIDIAREDPDRSKSSAYLSKAIATIERARALTLQLLTFAKGGAPVQKVDRLFPFVKEAAQFALSGSSVTGVFDVPNNLWDCNFDRNQIGQVIDNLVINAQQAMPLGGTIELSACNVVFADNGHPLLVKGNYVRISVKDSGIGIPKELLTRVFDPFFTTKAKGHGLGLATCYSIVSRHGGSIDVASEPGIGTTFDVYLPASEAFVQADGNIEHPQTHHGFGIFLVMDDEAVMRETISAMLGSFGYTVVCKENGSDAASFFAEAIRDKSEIAAVMLDLTVPGGIGGKAALDEIRKLSDKIPVFVVSGYAEDPVMKNPAAYGFTASICKPFRRSELSEMLNEYVHGR